jgi:hypothetical protein
MTSKNVPRAGSLVAAGNATANGVIITNRWLQIDSQTDLERSSRMKHQPFSTTATARCSYGLAVIMFAINNTGNETV